jgi:hypothetical protein
VGFPSTKVAFDIGAKSRWDICYNFANTVYIKNINASYDSSDKRLDILLIEYSIKTILSSVNQA